MLTTISFIRHGQVENPGQLYYGRLPRFALSALGRQQAQAAADALGGVELCAVYSSPMLRTRQTAQMIASHYPGLRVRISRKLNEVYSPFDGCTQQALMSRGWDVYTGAPAPYEQPEDILRRAQDFIAQVLRRHPGRHSAAVTHGDLILFLTRWANNQPLRGRDEPFRYPEPASITTLTFEGQELRALSCTYREP
jgi:broad specificity phosphatase PhoE